MVAVVTLDRADCLSVCSTASTPHLGIPSFFTLTGFMPAFAEGCFEVWEFIRPCSDLPTGSLIWMGGTADSIFRCPDFNEVIVVDKHPGPCLETDFKSKSIGFGCWDIDVLGLHFDLSFSFARFHQSGRSSSTLIPVIRSR